MLFYSFPNRLKDIQNNSLTKFRKSRNKARVHMKIRQYFQITVASTIFRITVTNYILGESLWITDSESYDQKVIYTHAVQKQGVNEKKYLVVNC
jgi:hypothetical protein